MSKIISLSQPTVIDGKYYEKGEVVRVLDSFESGKTIKDSKQVEAQKLQEIAKVIIKAKSDDDVKQIPDDAPVKEGVKK